MPELESSDSEYDDDNDMVRRSTLLFHFFYSVHRCTRRSCACACTASPQGTAHGDYLDLGPGPPKTHDVFWQSREHKRAEGKGPFATYKGCREAQMTMDRLYPARDCFASRPMSNLPVYSDPMPANFTLEEVIIARSVFKLNRADGARLHR